MQGRGGCEGATCRHERYSPHPTPVQRVCNSGSVLAAQAGSESAAGSGAAGTRGGLGLRGRSSESDCSFAPGIAGSKQTCSRRRRFATVLAAQTCGRWHGGRLFSSTRTPSELAQLTTRSAASFSRQTRHTHRRKHLYSRRPTSVHSGISLAIRTLGLICGRYIVQRNAHMRALAAILCKQGKMPM